jgi:predicted TPR repeat methyltransferase
MTGVDISEKMLAAAREKRLYDTLHLSAIIDFLTAHPSSSYDLVVSGDVLPYIGDLEELFLGVSRVLTAPGHFMFSVEHHSDEVLVPVLQQSGRFAHSQAYVTSIADKTGWQIIGRTLLDLRRERDEWIQGSIYLMSLSSIS